MSWFRRGRRRESDAGEPDAVVGGAAEQPEHDEQDAHAGRAEDAAAAAQRAATSRGEGPFDESEADDGVTRIDLGALQVPPREGMELRLELEEKSQRVVAVTITLAGSSVQMQAFAAPRTEGIWEEIRAEIAAQVTRQGGTADEVPGTFGREVLARLPARTADGRTGHQVARFTGIDGPRWFLRAVFNGQAAVDEQAAVDLEQVVRGVVVVRGSEAMAPRDLLPLKLPAQPSGAAGAVETAPGAAADTTSDAGAGESGAGPLDPFRRGPEITEIR